MRKIISVFAVIALLVVFCLPAMATQLADDKHVIVNNSGVQIATLVPITLIIPLKSRVISVTCTPIMTTASSSTENIVAIYDVATVSSWTEVAHTKFMEGEVERDDAYTSSIEWKRPLKIYNGCVIGQGARTIVTIEYEDIPQP